MKFKFLVAFLAFILGTASLIAADGTYKIEELYAKNTQLDGTNITVKGSVVKISAGIMRKDWIHIQDDSTTPNKNKVIFTSKMDSSKVKVGDKVTASGKLKAKVDIGSGYFYEVLIEDSSFVK